MKPAEENTEGTEINPSKDQKVLKQQLIACRSSDRFRLSKRINQLYRFKKNAKQYLLKVEKLSSDLETSATKRKARLANLPKPNYPTELPVAERREEIINTIRDNQVTIICGETGSGKTTQLPKMCLELGRGVDGIIGHTQPRRIAARSVAARIAEELNSELGDVIGYKVRFHDHTKDDDKQEESSKEETKEKDMLQAVVDATDELMGEKPGGILIFFSGEREIRLASEALRKHHKPSVEILPLFARLSSAEQSKIFQPSGARRIILATNVAETSLTVPGIKYVVDTGLARISRYSWRSRVQRLPIEKVSQASANQRSGRCGRTSSGIAIRLYAEDDYASRPEFTLPEIQRTNLASVILQLTSLNLGDVFDFPYLEKPDAGMIRDGYKLLFELGAVNKAKGNDIKLTHIGRQLASYPTDPRLARMLLAAKEYGVFDEVLVIVSALSIQDPTRSTH